MYIHDATYSHNGEVDEPFVVSTPYGHNMVLPKSTTEPERSRAMALFDQLFSYISAVNTFAHTFVNASQAMEQMDPGDIDHTVLMIQGRRSLDEQRAAASARRTGATGERDRPQATRSPFAIAAGHLGRMHGMPEMCLLCPRVDAPTNAWT